MADAEGRCDVVAMLKLSPCTKICAPMVRYSKLAFRSLVRKYGCDLAFTPMIIADSFTKSRKARDADFTTNAGDRPLVVQFAARNVREFGDAAVMVSPYADGVDLNCGCPQRKTVELCRAVEHAGASFITVHGRTKLQRCEPVNTEAVQLITSSIGIPVIHNGDVTSLETMDDIVGRTGVNGVMAARGILQNPAMFSGQKVSRQVVADWVDAAMSCGTPFPCFHHHTHTMLESSMSRAERRVFNTLQSTAAVLDYLDSNYVANSNAGGSGGGGFG